MVYSCSVVAMGNWHSLSGGDFGWISQGLKCSYPAPKNKIVTGVLYCTGVLYRGIKYKDICILTFFIVGL